MHVQPSAMQTPALCKAGRHSLVARGIEVRGDRPDGAIVGNYAVRGREVVNELDDRQRLRVVFATIEGREVEGARLLADRQILRLNVPQLVRGLCPCGDCDCEVPARQQLSFREPN